jgi:hypothetical protein
MPVLVVIDVIDVIVVIDAAVKMSRLQAVVIMNRRYHESPLS